MNNPENFEALRKLLALKRYEQPPPGYFDRLPGKILARIEAGEAQSSVWEQILSLFSKPAVAFSLGLGICAVLAGGAIYSINLPPSETPAQLAVEPWKTSVPAPLASAPRAFEPVQGSDLASTNPVTTPQPRSLFDNIEPRVAPASYTPGQ